MFTFKKTKLSSEDELRVKIHTLNHELNMCAKENHKLKVALRQEVMNRKAVVDFIDKACVKRLNEDGTTTHTMTTFVADLTNLLITREDLGVNGEF